MAEFQINRGIGKTVEFQGLKSQYIFILAGGLLAIFLIYIIMYMVGTSQSISITFTVISGLVLTKQTFSLNAKYGEHGLMKRTARGYQPRYIINRRQIPRLFNTKQNDK
ncbi:MAG: DUF4133 domain-containing protein [Rikenellaceae bacterium]